MRIKGWMGRADQTAKVRGMFVHPSQIAEVRAPPPRDRPGRLVIEGEMANDRMSCWSSGQWPGRGPGRCRGRSVRDVTKLRGDDVLCRAGQPAQRRQGDRGRAQLQVRPG
jgi:phenylacetate-CoA ligase